MAATLTGAQAFQPALVTRPASLYRSVSPAARLRLTAFARVPPNQAAKPTSWRARDGKLRTMSFLFEVVYYYGLYTQVCSVEPR